MMPKMSRRLFLRSVATLLTAAGLGGCISDRLKHVDRTAQPTRESGPSAAEIVQLLRQEFDYLDLHRIDLDAFAREFQDKASQQTLLSWGSDRAQFAYDLKAQFLLSTDFFWNDADESRPLQYRRYFDLYDSCQNPFARFA